jgi:hypothetical protein
MNLTDGPATLPQPYRPEKSTHTPKVRDLRHNGFACTVPEAIRVDRNWGVWIDLDAPIKFKAPSAPEPPAGYPVYVFALPGDTPQKTHYSIQLGPAKAMGFSWSPSQLESFSEEGVTGLDHFAPVSKVE